MARRVEFSRACAFRSECVGAVEIFAVRVCGIPKKLESCVGLHPNSRSCLVLCELVELSSLSWSLGLSSWYSVSCSDCVCVLMGHVYGPL